MNPNFPPPFPPPPHFGRSLVKESNVKSVLAYFISACFLYAVAGTLFYRFLGPELIVIVSILLIALVFVIFGLFKDNKGYFMRFMKPVLIFIPFILTNIILSTSSFESAARWFLWLAMVYGIGSMASISNFKTEESLRTWSPFIVGFIWIMFLGYGMTLDVSENASSPKHLSGFYANVMLVCGLMHPKKWFRVVFGVLALIGLYFSGSRGALISAPLTLIVPVFYYARNKVAASLVMVTFMSLLVGSFYAFPTFYDNLIGQKAMAAGYANMTGFEHMARSGEDRAWLRDYGYALVEDRPLGWGLGNTYTIWVGEKSRGTNLHNGLLNVAVQLGVVGFIVYMASLIFFSAKVMFNRRLPRISRYFFGSLLMAAMFRSLSEDFTFLDLGHFTVYFILYFMIFYSRERRRDELVMPTPPHPMMLNPRLLKKKKRAQSVPQAVSG